MKNKFEIKYQNYLEELYSEYEKLLRLSFSKDFWAGGKYSNQRIKWKNVQKAIKELEEFKMSGIYIWGVITRPLYIGKTEDNFASKFNRFIGDEKSQCKLAEIYSDELKNGGKNKSVEELAIAYGISHVTANSVKTFGELGANKLWFILIPIAKEIVSNLEIALINVGNKWNEKKHLLPLINLELKKEAIPMAEAKKTESEIVFCIDCKAEVDLSENFFMKLFSVENKQYRCEECYGIYREAKKIEDFREGTRKHVSLL